MMSEIKEEADVEEGEVPKDLLPGNMIKKEPLEPDEQTFSVSSKAVFAEALFEPGEVDLSQITVKNEPKNDDWSQTKVDKVCQEEVLVKADNVKKNSTCIPDLIQGTCTGNLNIADHYTAELWKGIPSLKSHKVSKRRSRRRCSQQFCWNCEKQGHHFRLCAEPRKRFCFRCGIRGHTVLTCSNYDLTSTGLFGVVPFIPDYQNQYLEWHDEMDYVEGYFKANLLNKVCRYCCSSGFASARELFMHVHSHSLATFYCTICQAGFSSIMPFQRHAKTHKGRTVLCTTCFGYFKSKKALATHKHNHRTGKYRNLLQCAKCLQYFKQFKSLKAHILTCYDIEMCKKCGSVPKGHDCSKFSQNVKQPENYVRKNFDCGLCPKQLNSFDALMLHRKSHVIRSSQMTSYQARQCQWCGRKEFANWLEYTNHLKGHTGRFYHCFICHRGFCRMRDSVSHFAKHLKKNYRLCPCCHLLVGMDRNHYRSHMKKHGQKPPFHCDICQAVFKNRNNLVKHVLSHLTHRCKKCNLTFDEYFKFYNHMYVHEKKYKCKKCNKAFGRKDYLQKHIASHSQNRVFKCPICLNRFSRSDNFKSHLERMHKTNEKFTCDCGKTFQHKRSRSIHNQIHRGTIFFHCHLCPVMCKTFLKIKIHIQSKHLNIPSHACEKCDKEFLKSESLIFHYEKKHGKIKSICHVCGTSFDSYGDLINHEKAHVGPTFDCLVCDKNFDSKKELTKHKISTHKVLNKAKNAPMPDLPQLPQTDLPFH